MGAWVAAVSQHTLTLTLPGCRTWADAEAQTRRLLCAYTCARPRADAELVDGWLETATYAGELAEDGTWTVVAVVIV